MCGITGWISYDKDLTAEREVLDAMNRTMSCRGPDADGLWLDTHAALGHRRLAVIDIEGGTQPMSVERDGRTVLVTTYSGEIYNYRELREELGRRGHAFRTSSDTEVALHACLEWGEGFTERLNGMYAFALWDPREQQLLLVRDRMGIKPLYYYPTPDGVLFGSEPKAILAHPSVRPARTPCATGCGGCWPTPAPRPGRCWRRRRPSGRRGARAMSPGRAWSWRWASTRGCGGTERSC